MTKRLKLTLELIFLFVGTPIILISSLPLFLKLGLAGTGVIYAIWISMGEKILNKEILIGLPKIGWLTLSLKFAILVLVSVILMYIYNREDLFIVIKEDLSLWISITFFYSIFSVYPQEFIYRTFFFHRYQFLFKNKLTFVIINACLFSFAHIIFMNGFVLILTLVGGFAFAFTYTKSKSLLFVSVEHALYGSWIFTLGMGEMLAFPMPG